MDFLKIRLSGVMTVETSFVMGIILLIILYQITFTLDLFSKVQTYAKDTVERLKDRSNAIQSMRLTEMALHLSGRGE